MNDTERARDLADRYWVQLLELEPTLGTEAGDERFDDRLGDPSEAGRADAEAVHRGALAELGHDRPDGGRAHAAEHRRRDGGDRHPVPR